MEPQALARTFDSLPAAVEQSLDWQALLTHFDYHQGFAFGLLTMRNEVLLSACRASLKAHLAIHGRSLLDLSPRTPDELVAVCLSLRDREVAPEVGAIWIGVVISEHQPEFEAWRKAFQTAFARLNPLRNALQHRLHTTLLFAGAPWVQSEIRREAPDLWSVRSLVTSIDIRVPDAELQLARRPDILGADPDPDSAPDPEFALEMAERFRGKPGQELTLARLLLRAGQGFEARSQTELAAKAFLQALELGERHGASEAEVAVALMNLASAKKDAGRYEEARSLESRALEIRARLLGADHPDTLTAMNNLASTLSSQGEFAGARQLQERVLEARTRVLDAEHAATLISMSNLAMSLWSQGDYAGARQLQERVLEAMRRVLGADHPQTLISMNNLALTLWSQGDHAGARQLEEHVLELTTRLLGADHPDTLTSMGNLAHTLWSQGDHAGARQLQERVLEATTRVLGTDHPDTLTSMNNLAMTLRVQGDYDGARRLHERELEACTRVLGADHPDTLTSMNNLAITLWDVGEKPEALALIRRCLAGRRRALGDQHPETVGTAQTLAEWEQSST